MRQGHDRRDRDMPLCAVVTLRHGDCDATSVYLWREVFVCCWNISGCPNFLCIDVLGVK